MKRLFLAIELPDEMRRAFFEWQGDYRHTQGVKWVPAENLHITAAFLGDVEDKRIRDLIRDLIREINLKPFKLEFRKMVLAPPGGKFRMIWADFYNAEDFNNLVEKIWQAAEKYVNLDINIKKAAIHVTMCRFRQPVYLSGLKQPEFAEKSFEVKGVNLMESELASQRPHYKKIINFKL